MGILYIVATPIGNLQDISFRAVKTLTNVDYIACEDTRKTSALLKSFRKNVNSIISGDYPHLISYYEQNEHKRIPQIINALKNGKNVALVSDAGTPTISDPGYKLVRECIKLNIKVEAIPGPSSLMSAIVVSGLPTDKFLFIGYLPKKEGKRKKYLENIKKTQKYIESTVIIFESPHKLLRTLKEILDLYGNIDITIARELTKIHEEVKRDKISRIIEYYSDKNRLRGEIIILFSFKS